MALQKEIWVSSIVEKLFANDTFASRAQNHSAFSDGKKVHVPNAGALPPVTVDNTTYPVEHSERTDTDLNYDLHKYEIGPVRVGSIDDVQLSYDKRTSVLTGVSNSLTEKVYSDILTGWVAACSAAANKTVAATFGKAAVLAIKLAFDKKDIPQNGRCIVLTPEAYNELLDELSDAEQFAFSAAANSANGTVGKYLGFDFYMRSTIDTAASNKTTAFAWQQDCVSVALGNVDVIDNPRRVEFFGDIIGATVLAGGSYVRSDKAGIFKVTSA